MAQALPEARVIKALNAAAHTHLKGAPSTARLYKQLAVPVGGKDAAAKGVVIALIQSIGFNAFCGVGRLRSCTKRYGQGRRSAGRGRETGRVSAPSRTARWAKTQKILAPAEARFQSGQFRRKAYGHPAGNSDLPGNCAAVCG